MWIPLTGDLRGYYRCRVCEDTDDIARKHIKAHEQTKRHKKNALKASKRPDRPDHSSPGPSQHDIPLESLPVQEVLLDVLEESIDMFESGRDNASAQSTGTGVIDWAQIAPGTTSLVTPDDLFLAQLSQRLKTYLLDDGAIGLPSDDDAEGDDDCVAEETVAEQPDVVEQQLAGARRSRRVVSDEYGPWFPWPDREVSAVLLTHGSNF